MYVFKGLITLRHTITIPDLTREFLPHPMSNITESPAFSRLKQLG